jgi:hypothetical protein
MRALSNACFEVGGLTFLFEGKHSERQGSRVSKSSSYFKKLKIEAKPR